MSLVDLETGEIVAPTLESCERVIESGLQTFVEVGNALLTIRDERLYRSGWKTFESYCQERWSFSYQRAHQLVDAAQIANALSTMVEIRPTNERQVRELMPLRDEPAALAEAWRDANETADAEGKPVTAAAVKRAVAKDRPSRSRPWTRPGNGGAAKVLKNLVAIGDSLKALSNSECKATREDVEGLDRTIKALRQFRNSLVVEE